MSLCLMGVSVGGQMDREEPIFVNIFTDVNIFMIEMSLRC